MATQRAPFFTGSATGAGVGWAASGVSLIAGYLVGGGWGWRVEHIAPVGAGLHLLAGGVIQQRLRAVPAAAEGFVQGDQVADRAAAAEQVAVLLHKQRALGVQYALEVGVTFAVLGAGQGQRTLRRERRFTQDALALQGLAQAGGGVVGLASGLQHAVLISHQQLL